MRHLRFTWKGYTTNFVSLITNSPAFQFDMSEIARIREEMTTLIDNLSKLYLPWLEEQELAERTAKRVARLKDSFEVVSGDANEVSTDMEDEGNLVVASIVNEAYEDNAAGKDGGYGDGVDDSPGAAIVPSAEKENVLNISSELVLTTLNDDEDSFSPLDDEDENGSECLLCDLGNAVLEMVIEQENNEQEWDSPTEDEVVISQKL